MPNGEKQDEVDLRAQVAGINLHGGQRQRTEPLTIGSDVSAFTYSPLARPASMIWLLKIKPAIFRADSVECDLLDFDINSAPAFGALSYRWGRPPDDCKMLCNGKVFHIRANLQRALKRLRAGFRPGERDEYIWADALCINQQDAAEKNCQLRLMERIYSSAGTVYIDLGDIAGRGVSVGGSTFDFSNLGGMGTPDALAQEFGVGHPLTFHTVFLALGQPWFTRTWIIQEAALARVAKYMFGGTIFTQEQLDGFLSPGALQANPERLQ